MRDPDWLLDSTPRQVQLEALRRSYGGFKKFDGLDSEPRIRVIRPGLDPAKGWCHYLEMRLGKTPVTINEFELFKRDHGIRKCIVICPNTFKQGWVDEAEKSYASVPWFAWGSMSYPKLAEELRKAMGSFGLAVNYEALKTEGFKEFVYTVIKDSMLVFDESIKIKDHQSVQTKEALLLAKDARVVRNLSGLPMTQGPQDLYTQFRAVGQFDGVNFYSYRNRFCKMGGFKAKKVVGVINEDLLKLKMDECSFVAKQIDWSKPGVSQYFVEKLQMTPQQKKHYNDMDKEMTMMLESGVEVSVDMVISKMMKLQQISSGFIYAEGKHHWIERLQSLPKIAKLKDLVEETDSKVIVNYHYGASGDILLEAFKHLNPAVIRGNEWMMKNNKNVDDEKKKFNTDPSCRMMVLQISAGKYGHDLSGIVGDRCRVMAFYENTYSLDDRVQIEARNTTAFQDWVNSYHDFSCSKVEDAAIKALASKTSVAEAVIGHIKGAG